MTEREREYTSREAAKLIGVYFGTIDRWIREGKLLRDVHFFGPPRRRRFTESQIEKIKRSDL